MLRYRYEFSLFEFTYLDILREAINYQTVNISSFYLKFIVAYHSHNFL